MKNAKWTAGAVIIIVAIAVAAFAIFHNSSSPTVTNSTNTTGNTPANQNSIIHTKTDSALGDYLADSTGRPLYTYNGDNPNTSNCTGSCLVNWPAYTASSSVANLPAGITTFKRSDSNDLQYAYNGKPLYYFVSDSNGQVTGNGVENFQVAKPAATQNTNSSEQPASTNPYGSSY